MWVNYPNTANPNSHVLSTPNSHPASSRIRALASTRMPVSPLPTSVRCQDRPHIHDQGLWSWRKVCCWRKPQRLGWWGHLSSDHGLCPAHFQEGSVPGSPEASLGPERASVTELLSCKQASLPWQQEGSGHGWEAISSEPSTSQVG